MMVAMRLAITSALALSACGVVGAAGYTNRISDGADIGDGGAALRFVFTGDGALEGDGGVWPAMLVDGDFGDFGGRFATYLGVAHGFGDATLGFVRGGVSLLSVGHEADDPDPDPWVGVSATIQTGAWFPIGDGERIELGVGLAADTGWTGAGAGVYAAIWLGIGTIIEVDLSRWR